MTREDGVAQYKYKIKQVEREIKNEPDKKKKQRLNQYKQRLEKELRDFTFFMNGGRLERGIN